VVAREGSSSPPSDQCKFQPIEFGGVAKWRRRGSQFCYEQYYYSTRSQYPLFVGWTPTRNIFKILASFQEKVDAGMKTLETDMTSMKVDMAIMKTLETPASS